MNGIGNIQISVAVIVDSLKEIFWNIRGVDVPILHDVVEIAVNAGPAEMNPVQLPVLICCTVIRMKIIAVQDNRAMLWERNPLAVIFDNAFSTVGVQEKVAVQTASVNDAVMAVGIVVSHALHIHKFLTDFL